MILAAKRPTQYTYGLTPAAHQVVLAAPQGPTYNQIKALERSIVEELEPVEEKLEHLHIPGVYTRKLTLPAGTVIVGKVHKDMHVCIVAKGRLQVVSEGKPPVTLVAGDAFVSEPGAKRAGYCLEEVVFINVHHNEDNEQDLKVLEAKYIAPEALEYKRVEVLT